MRRNTFHYYRGIIHPYKSNTGNNSVKLITAGGYYSSATQISVDGINWQPTTTGANGAYNAVYCGKYKTFVVCGPGFIRVYNAENLAAAPTVVTLPSGYANGASIAYHPPTGNVAIANFGGGNSHYSTNGGYTWTSTTAIGSSDMMTYNYDNGDLVQVTRDGSMGRSSNGGVSWVTMTGPAASTRLGVAYAFGKYWVTSLGSSSIYWTNNNGASWTPVDVGNATSRIHFAKEANILFAAYGAGVTYTNNGTTWQNSSLPPGSAGSRSLGYSPTVGRFYVGTTGEAYMSSDMLTWSAMAGTASFDHYAFAVADPLFV